MCIWTHISFGGVCSGTSEEGEYGTTITMMISPPHWAEGVKFVEGIRHIWEGFLRKDVMCEKELRIGISLSGYVHF